MHNEAAGSSVNRGSTKRFVKRWQWFFVVVLVLVGGTIVILWKVGGANPSPIPSQVTKQVKFSLYYPKELPSGYILDQNSITSEHDTVVYTLQSADKSIVVTQQPNPQEKILFERLGGFSPLGTSVGQAYIGQVDGRQVVLAQTATTLITITAGDGTARADLENITQNLINISN